VTDRLFHTMGFDPDYWRLPDENPGNR